MKQFRGFKTYKGKFNPKNPDKYSGTTPIIYRSSWEYFVMRWCDNRDDVVQWGSESVVVPYYFDLDKKTHRYFIDFIMKFKTGSVYLIEIKPQSQTRLPELPKSGRCTKTYKTNLIEYAKNEAKWKAAKKYAEEHGSQFMVWTEETLKNIGMRVI